MNPRLPKKGCTQFVCILKKNSVQGLEKLLFRNRADQGKYQSAVEQRLLGFLVDI